MAAMDTTEWDIFVNSLAASSKLKYNRTVLEYHDYCEDEGFMPNEPLNILKFLNDQHEVAQLAASSLWTIGSILVSYFQKVRGVNPYIAVPGLRNTLKNWQKHEETKRAKTFTAEEITQFLVESPNDRENLPRKVATILAVYGFLRKTEITELTFTDVEIHEEHAWVYVYRQKQASSSRERSKFLISDSNSLGILKQYIECFNQVQY